HQPAVGKLDHSRRQDSGIADPNPRLGFASVGGTDVDPQVLAFGDLFALVLVHDMNCFFPDHAGYPAGAAQQHHALADEHLLVPPATRVEAQIALVIDVRDHHADLIDVAGKHEAGALSPLETGKGVSGDIRLHRVG